MKTYMFPGQGSQLKGMGGSLFDEFNEFIEIADKILGYSIKELCLNDPEKKLNQTKYTQPALYVVNALSYFKEIKDSNNRPDYVIGHSLGEFNALLAAECFDFEAGLKLVKKRGELMSQATSGGMAAILNGSEEIVRAILVDNGLTNIDLANYNTPSQIVISGLRDEIVRAEPFFQGGDILYYPLNTSGAFHSRYMQPAKVKFQTYIKKFKFSDPKIPVISNISATAYKSGEIVENLSRQIISMVKWSESIQYLLGVGASENESMEFKEIGHGDVLTKIFDTIVRETARSSKKIELENDISLLSTAKDTEVQDQSTSGKEESEGISNEVAIVSEPATLEVDSVKIEPAQEIEKILENVVGAEDKVSAWNRSHPIGTKVKSTIMEDDYLETRTEAVVLFGQRAAVYMKEYNGYFDLDEIIPL